MAARLDYLDFDFSDEESGRGSFDAMASVLPDRLPALLAEIDVVLAWAASTFGTAGAGEEEGQWGYELLTLAPEVGLARTTMTFTLSGSPAFCEAFREKFGIDD